MRIFTRADFDPAFLLCDLSCFQLERADFLLLFDSAETANEFDLHRKVKSSKVTVPSCQALA